ncbi:hypothetical protein HK405_015562, partial [Cladochytrium tenue]
AVIKEYESGRPVRIIDEILDLGMTLTVEEAHDIERLACANTISLLTCPCGSGYLSKGRSGDANKFGFRRISLECSRSKGAKTGLRCPSIRFAAALARDVPEVAKAVETALGLLGPPVVKSKRDAASTTPAEPTNALRVPLG